MRKLLTLALFCLATLLPASAATVYVAATAGVVSGGTLCNGQTAVLISSITWTGGNTYIFCGTFTASAGAGGYITVGASGSSGNPITLELDSNTVIQAPYWGTGGAFNFNNQSYVTLNCLSQGSIKSTANGAGLTYQQPAYNANAEYPLISMGTGSNNTVENCPLGPNYIHVASILVTNATGNGTTATLTLASACPYAIGNTVWVQGINPAGYNNVAGATVTACSGTSLSYANTTTATYVGDGFLTDEAGFGADGITANLSGGVSTTNITISGNVIHDVHWAISGGVTAGQTLSNVSIQGNTLYNNEHSIAWFDNNDGLSTWSGTNTVSGNVMHDWANWDDQVPGHSGLDQNHHDAIHIGAQYGSSGSQSQFSGFSIYNNLMYGNPGQGMTTMLYLFGTCQVGQQGCMTGTKVFNNLFVNQSPGCVGSPANGLFLNWTTGVLIENNDFIGCGTSSNPSGQIGIDEYTYQSQVGSTYKNNIFTNLNIAIYFPGAPFGFIVASDYNDFYNLGSVGAVVGNGSPGPYYATLANWQACTTGGCPATHDTNSTSGNPLLTSTYQLPSSSSAAWKAGANLYSTCNGQPNPGLGALCSDYASVVRPTSGNWDIGAYESSTNPPSIPTLSPAAPATFSSSTAVTMTSATTGATIIYTIDGSTPATSSGCTASGTGTAVTNGSSYTVTSTLTLEAIACLAGVDSAAVSGVYTVGSTLSAPTCTPGTGTTNNNPNPACTGPAGSTLCYTTSGTAPTAPTGGTCGSGSTTYAGAISITATATNLQVLATKSGYTNSSAASYTYTLTVATPVCTPDTGTYTGTQSVTCTDPTTGSAIYYAVGTTPTCSSTLYSGAISVAASETLSFIACLSGYNTSTVLSYVYTINNLLSVSITGSATMTSSPSGITLTGPGSTSAAYATGTNVTLTIAPIGLYYFNGWGGACSGIATTCTVAMSAAKSVTAAFSVNTGCGNPYPNARCDLGASTLPSPTPNFGNLTGAGTCWVDPNFGTTVCRITDSATNRSTQQYESTYVNSSGSAEENLISCTSPYLAMISNSSAAQMPITFNPLGNVTNPRLYTTTDASTNGYLFPAGSAPIGWSRICPANNQLAYILAGSDGATIQTVNFAGNCASCVTPSPTTIFDFESTTNGLGPNFFVTWNATGGTTVNDTDIAIAFGGAVEWTNSFNYQTYANGVISGMIVYPTTGNAGNYLYQASAACTGQATGTPTWNQTVGGTNSDGSCTMTNVGTGGQEDTGSQYIAVWRSGSGARVLNVATGVVAGDWGPTGAIPSFPCEGLLHEVKLAKVGGSQGWTTISYGAPCVSSAEYGWNYAQSSLTGSFYVLCNSAQCGGHKSSGMLAFQNNPGDNVPNFFDICFVGGSSLLCPTNSANGVTSALPVGGASGFDSHWGWQSTNDTLPFCGATWTSTVPAHAWVNEVMCIPPVYAAGVNPWRFAQTENTGQNADFHVQQAISIVSTDGNWMMVDTDMQGKWGSTAGASTCTITTNCRGDILAIYLNPTGSIPPPTPTAPSVAPCVACIGENSAPTPWSIAGAMAESFQHGGTN
jgi:hypothetical protein